MSTHTITIGEVEYTLRPLSADAALRLLDMAADSAEEIQTVIDRANAWRRRYSEENAIAITEESFNDPGQAEQLEEAGYTRERVKEAGVIRLPIEPSEAETFASILPGLYRTLRDPILTACAIMLAPGDEILEAEDNGQLEEYLAGWRRTIRANATPDQLGELVHAAWEQASDELIGGAVGKLMGRFQGVISPTAEPAPEEKPPAKTKPRSSTRSRARTAGGGATSS